MLWAKKKIVNSNENFCPAGSSSLALLDNNHVLQFVLTILVETFPCICFIRYMSLDESMATAMNLMEQDEDHEC